LLKSAHVGVGPRPAVYSAACDPFPQHWIANRPQAQRGEPVDIVDSQRVSIPGQLVEEHIADAIHGALDAAPNLERSGRNPLRFSSKLPHASTPAEQDSDAAIIWPW